MPLRDIRPTSAGRRHQMSIDHKRLNQEETPKKLTVKKSKISGRNNQGKITVRHRGGAQKRKLRIIDFKRNKREVFGKVIDIQYDPNRSANIALITYEDGDKRFILAPDNLEVGAQIVAAEKAEVEPGNAMPLRQIPIGMPIHNLELRPGKGGQVVRGAGTAALIQSKDDKFATVLLPSKEIRLFPLDAYATIGQVSNQEWKAVHWGKAGRKRNRGFRPAVRGTAQHPGSHPHGGGEGRSGIGMPSPKSPWGKKTLGKKTRKANRYSNKYIVRDRRTRK